MGGVVSDTERLDFLDRMMVGGPNQRHFNLDGSALFTIQTQHQTVSSVREAIDLMEGFESGRLKRPEPYWPPEVRSAFAKSFDDAIGDAMERIMDNPEDQQPHEQDKP